MPSSATPWPRNRMLRHRRARAGGPVVETIDELLAREVFTINHLEAEPLERGADGARIVDCFLKLLTLRQVGIAVVADHEGDAPLGKAGCGAEHERDKSYNNGYPKMHGCLPCRRSTPKSDILLTKF